MNEDFSEVLDSIPEGEAIKDIGILAAKLQVIVAPIMDEMLRNNIDAQRSAKRNLSPLTLTNIAVGGAIKAIREALNKVNA